MPKWWWNMSKISSDWVQNAVRLHANIVMQIFNNCERNKLQESSSKSWHIRYSQIDNPNRGAIADCAMHSTEIREAVQRENINQQDNLHGHPFEANFGEWRGYSLLRWLGWKVLWNTERAAVNWVSRTKFEYLTNSFDARTAMHMSETEMEMLNWEMLYWEKYI